MKEGDSLICKFRGNKNCLGVVAGTADQLFNGII